MVFWDYEVLEYFVARVISASLKDRSTRFWQSFKKKKKDRLSFLSFREDF